MTWWEMFRSQHFLNYDSGFEFSQAKFTGTKELKFFYFI